MKTFYWDFTGPNAEPTAEHFLQHLDDFLVKNACSGCTTGVVAEAPGHHAVWCRTPPDYERGLESSLKPRRFTEE
jgi:hypothetical protein